MAKALNIAINYTIFALLATITNLAAQELMHLWGPFTGQLYIAILVGTACGLVVKYVLDKCYIFQFTTTHIKQEGATFIKYCMMGGVTTLLFWGAEIGFDWFFQSKTMRYIGAILGLGIGYYLKYQLDKRYVFIGKS